MNDEQLSDDGVVAATQILSMGAMRYAGKTVTAAIGEPPPGSNALATLDRARQIIAAEDSLPAPVTDALRDLQIAAVLFTVQLATSNSGDDPALQQLKDKLVATLERQGAARVLHVHDGAAAAQCLGDRALDYTRQIIIAEDSGVPIGSDAVERSIADLHVAAVTFTVQLAISEGHAPEMLRQMEKLVAMFTRQGGS